MIRQADQYIKDQTIDCIDIQVTLQGLEFDFFIKILN